MLAEAFFDLVELVSINKKTPTFEGRRFYFLVALKN